MTEEERGTIAQEEEIAYYKEMAEERRRAKEIWEERKRIEDEYYDDAFLEG